MSVVNCEPCEGEPEAGSSTSFVSGRNFTRQRPVMSEAVRQQIRRELLEGVADGERRVFVAKGSSAIVLDECTTAGAWLRAMAECGEPGCACSRLSFPRVRPLFREIIAARAPREVRYVSLAAGQLLADADILCSLVGAGATIRSISLVDAGYARPSNQRDVAALNQLAALMHPARVTAYDSLGGYAEACAADGYERPNVLVANDPATPMALVFKRFASHALVEGGHAFLLLNGGDMGASARAWRKGATTTGLDAARLPSTAAECDVALGLEELPVEVGGDAATPPPGGAGGAQRLRGLFDRDSLQECVEHAQLVDEHRRSRIRNA